MGGYGSGRTGHKQKAEHCKSLDVNRLHREGCLRPGRRGNWVWSRDGEEVGRIDYQAEEGRLVLDYKVRQYGGDWERITQPVPITHADCNYGGQRPYFRCPGVVDGRHFGFTPCERPRARGWSAGSKPLAVLRIKNDRFCPRTQSK